MRLRGSGNRRSSGRKLSWRTFYALAACTLLAAAAPSNLFDLAETGSADQLQQALKGGNVNAVDDVGRTLLMHAAAFNPDSQVISVLVKAGANVNARGPRQWTALMMAAYENPNPAVVEALLAAGANGKLRSDAGETAYDYARDNDHLKGTPAYARLRSAAGGANAGSGER